MSFDGRHRAASTDKPAPSGRRVELLHALAQVLTGTWGVSAEPLVRKGSMVLFVVSHVPTTRRADISADFDGGEWWFCWVEDGRTIGRTDDTQGAAEIIITWLRRPVNLP